MLIERVLENDARLVVVRGPAGSGKSTLLAQICDEVSDPVWLSLEATDDDPAALWSALIDSTSGLIPGFGADYRRWLDAGGAEAVGSVLPLFVNELASTGRSVHFLLDDLHLLSGQRSLDSLGRLINALPAGCCVVVAGRTAVPFRLGRLRMRRALVEVDPGDLAMDLAEARAAMSAVGIDLPEDQVESLVVRTEGWAAGLAWATLAMKAQPGGRRAIDAIDPLDGQLATYLVEEVLDRQPPEIRAFMLETAILKRFNAALCDRLRGCNDSRLLLDKLERGHSFLISLDGHGEWYRYHHLVHDVLEARLRREAPESMARLHRRASAWLREHNEIVESVRHARAAGDVHEAADVVCANWWQMFNFGGSRR